MGRCGLIALLTLPLFAVGQSPAPDSLLTAIRALSAIDQIKAINAVGYSAVVDNLPKARLQLDHALALAHAIKDSATLADLHARHNLIAYFEGKDDESLKAAITALNLYHAIGKKNEEGKMYCGLGYQMKRRDMDKALYYMRTGLKLLEATNDTGLLNPANSNYGVLMEMTGKLDSAVIYYTRALTMQRAVNDSLGMPFSYTKLGGVLLMKGDVTAAREAFNMAYGMRLKRNDRYGIQETLIYFGELNQVAGLLDSARWYFERAVDSSIVLNVPWQRQYCFEQLVTVCRKQGDLEAALDYSLRHSAIKDSLINVDRNKQLAEFETRFETARKESENLELRNRESLNKAALARQRMWLSVLGALLALSFVATWAVVAWRRQRERLRIQAMRIDQKEKGLKAILEAQETERRNIARDLHDGVVQTLTGIKMQMQRAATSPVIDTGLVADAVAELDAASAEVRAISHRMMPRALSEVGLAAALETMLENTLGGHNIPFTFDPINTTAVRFTAEVEASYFRISQELINNVIKHAQAKSVSVSLHRSGGLLVLLIKDDGRGFDPDQKATGIGMLNIRTRAEQIGATLHLSSTLGQGTSATLRVAVG